MAILIGILTRNLSSSWNGVACVCAAFHHATDTRDDVGGSVVRCIFSEAGDAEYSP